MSQDYCRGCGTLLQTTNADAPGYIPESVLKKHQLTCQRCFKLTHYGDVGKIQPGSSKIWQAIRKAVNLSTLVVVVVDFTDLAGTVGVWKEFLDSLQKPYIMVLNKIDVLPRQTTIEEIAVYMKNYLNDLNIRRPEELIPTSSLKQRDLDKLCKQISRYTAKGDRVALLGATNVGKSSMIKAILNVDHSKGSPTISKFPGTTMGLSNWSILRGRNTIIDTPGLNPGTRLTDIVCIKCGSTVVAPKLDRKLWGIPSGKGLILGGIFGIENLSDDERVIIGFAPSGLTFHRTDGMRILELLQSAPEWLNKFCKGCIKKFVWEEHEIDLEAEHDIAVAGLGWISLRGQSAKLKIYVPQGLYWEIRPAVIGRKE